MIKHSALVSFLTLLDYFDAGNMDSFVDDLTVIPAGRGTDATGQIVVCEMEYTGVYGIADYPHVQIPVQRLLAQISAWLLDHDTDRTTAFDFSVNVETNPSDDRKADLEIRSPFREAVTASADAGGELALAGEHYDVDA